MKDVNFCPCSVNKLSSIWLLLDMLFLRAIAYLLLTDKQPHTSPTHALIRSPPGSVMGWTSPSFLIYILTNCKGLINEHRDGSMIKFVKLRDIYLPRKRKRGELKLMDFDLLGNHRVVFVMSYADQNWKRTTIYLTRFVCSLPQTSSLFLFTSQSFCSLGGVLTEIFSLAFLIRKNIKLTSFSSRISSCVDLE